ncbi:MAG: hypothetical protein ACYTF0_01245, partial [Planctomycetota bacterium]
MVDDRLSRDTTQELTAPDQQAAHAQRLPFVCAPQVLDHHRHRRRGLDAPDHTVYSATPVRRRQRPLIGTSTSSAPDELHPVDLTPTTRQPRRGLAITVTAIAIGLLVGSVWVITRPSTTPTSPSPGPVAVPPPAPSSVSRHDFPAAPSAAWATAVAQLAIDDPVLAEIANELAQPISQAQARFDSLLANNRHGEAKVLVAGLPRLPEHPLFRSSQRILTTMQQRLADDQQPTSASTTAPAQPPAPASLTSAPVAPATTTAAVPPTPSTAPTQAATPPVHLLAPASDLLSDGNWQPYSDGGWQLEQASGSLSQVLRLPPGPLHLHVHLSSSIPADAALTVRIGSLEHTITTFNKPDARWRWQAVDLPLSGDGQDHDVVLSARGQGLKIKRLYLTSDAGAPPRSFDDSAAPA